MHGCGTHHRRRIAAKRDDRSARYRGLSRRRGGVTLLSLQGLEAAHGQLKAVRGVSLSIEKAETVALVGANGAGKTTLLRAIAGAHRIEAGRIAFKGEAIGAKPSLARSAGRTGAWTLDAVMEAFPNLKDRRRSLAGTLSGGEQQATAIGRALM